jgi:thioredoxin 1
MTFVYIIIGILALFFGLQFFMIFSAKRAKGTKISGLKGSLKILEKNGAKGIVYFYSPSCRACKMQTPIIKSLQKANKNIFDVDISRDLETARIFGIKATPTTLAIRNGIIDQVYVGVKQQDIFEKFLRERN